MQREIRNKYFPGANLNPLNHVSSVPSIDNISSLDNAVKKVDLLGNLWEHGKTEVSLARYIPSITKPSRQHQIASIEEKKTYCDDTYNDKRNLEFVVKLSAGKHTNYSTMQLVLPVRFKKKTDEKVNLAGTVVTTNNFFTRWLKEISVMRYPDDITILPSNNTIPIADHAASILKHMTDDQLATINKTLLYSKKAVVIKGDNDRRVHNDNDATKRTGENIEKRIKEFHAQLGTNHY